MSLVCLFAVDSNRLVWEFVRIRQTEIWNLLTGPVNSLIKCCCFSLLNSTSAILLLFHFEDENFFVALSTRRFVHKTIREGNLVSSVFRSTFTYLINALRILAFCFLRFAKFSSLVLLLNVHLLHPILVYSILHIYWFTNFPPYPCLFHTPPLLDKTSRPSFLVLEVAATARQCCAYAAYTVSLRAEVAGT